MAEDIRGLARKGALADRRGVGCRSAVVRVTDTRWVHQDIAVGSAGPQQYSKIVRMDMDGGHLGIEGLQRRYSGESSLGQVGIAGRVEYSCRSVLVHRHGDWDHRGLAGFYYHAGQHRKVTEGEAVAVAVDMYEEAVGE